MQTLDAEARGSVLLVDSMWLRLSSEMQNQFLAALWESSGGVPGDGKRDRTVFALRGRVVCRSASRAVLGVSPKTIYRRLIQAADVHRFAQAPRRAPATFGVNLFFMELYHSSCEGLPEHIHTTDVDEKVRQDVEAQDAQAQDSSVPCPDPEGAPEDPPKRPWQTARPI